MAEKGAELPDGDPNMKFKLRIVFLRATTSSTRTGRRPSFRTWAPAPRRCKLRKSPMPTDAFRATTSSKQTLIRRMCRLTYVQRIHGCICRRTHGRKNGSANTSARSCVSKRRCTGTQILALSGKSMHTSSSWNLVSKQQQIRGLLVISTEKRIYS